MGKVDAAKDTYYDCPQKGEAAGTMAPGAKAAAGAAPGAAKLLMTVVLWMLLNTTLSGGGAT